MATFEQLDKVFDPRLKLPITDTLTVFIPEPDGELGLWITKMASAGMAVAAGQDLPAEAPSLQLDDKDEDALYRRMLGADNYAALQQVGRSTLKRVGETVFIWIAFGEDAAAAFWVSGDPKASAPRSVRRAAAKASTPTDAAPTTKPRASGSGMKPPRTSSPRRSGQA